MDRSTVGFSKKVMENTPISMVCLPATTFIYSVTAIPATMPTYPKKVVMVTLSEIISQRIDTGFAPNALRMPNSCVRSRTVISMMLLTPTMPLNSVKMPITQMAMCRICVAVCCWRYCVKRFQIQMAPSSVGSNSERSQSRWRETVLVFVYAYHLVGYSAGVYILSDRLSVRK